MAQRSLFDNNNRSSKSRSRCKSSIKERHKEKQYAIKGDTNTISGKIELARSTVERLLGYLRDELICITEEEELVKYIDTCIKDVEVGIDTETDSLDWLGGHIAGLCLYSESQKGCYIPINHISYMTGQRLKNQIPQEVVGRELKRLADSKAKFIFHNAKFDKHVIIHNFGFDVKAYWDTQIAGCLLNENEPHGLKYLWDKYCKPVTEEEESQPIATFSTLFEKVSFVQVPLDIAPLYAAEDPVKTFELYKFQKKIFERKGLEKVYKVFTDIEMPVLEVVTDMEETGVVLDVNLGQQLSERYHGYLKRIEEDINREYEKLEPTIAEFKSKNKSLGDKLEDPINFGSTTQLAILMYDVLKLESPDKKNPRGTGSDIIEKLQDKADILKYITEYREMGKLLGTYIDKLPTCISPVDNKLHGSYNQLGAKCIVGDSLLLTSDGYKRMDSIKYGKLEGDFTDVDYTIVNKHLELEKSDASIFYENRDTIRLECDYGVTIEGTLNHPIMVGGVTSEDLLRNHSPRNKRRLCDDKFFKQLSQISEGDYIEIPLGYNIFSETYRYLDVELLDKHTCGKECKLNPLLDEEMAEFIGMYYADGTVKDSNGSFTVIIHNQDIDVIKRVKYLVKNLFDLDCFEYPESGGSVSTGFSCARLSGLGKYLPRGARNKVIFSELMESPKSVISAFIRGLTLDSSYDPRRQRLGITTVNVGNRKFIQQVLFNVGIVSSIDIADSINSRVYISGSHYQKFIRDIGVVQSSKRDLTIKTFRNRNQIHGNSLWVKVKSITHSVNDVYDIHVPNTHSFIADGLINHNTGRFSSSDPKVC